MKSLMNCLMNQMHFITESVFQRRFSKQPLGLLVLLLWLPLSSLAAQPNSFKDALQDAIQYRDQGKPYYAIDALFALLESNPEWSHPQQQRLKLELAKSYYQAYEYELAARVLQHVLQDKNLPPLVVLNAKRLLGKTYAHKQHSQHLQHQFSAEISAFWGHDSNANISATQQDDSLSDDFVNNGGIVRNNPVTGDDGFPAGQGNDTGRDDPPFFEPDFPDESFPDEPFPDDINIDDGTFDQGFIPPEFDDGPFDDDVFDDNFFDDGTFDDDTFDEGTFDDGNFDQGTPDQGTPDQGTPDDNFFDDGAFDDGFFDRGGFADDRQGELPLPDDFLTDDLGLPGRDDPLFNDLSDLFEEEDRLLFCQDLLDLFGQGFPLFEEEIELCNDVFNDLLETPIEVPDVDRDISDTYTGVSLFAQHRVRFPGSSAFFGQPLKTEWNSSINYFQRDYDDVDRSDFRIISATTGPSFSLARQWRFSSDLHFSHIELGGDSLANYIGLQPALFWYQEPWIWQIRGHLTRRYYTEREDSDREGNRVALGLTWIYPFQPGWTVNLGFDKARQNVRDDILSYDSWEFHSRLEYKRPKSWKCYAEARYQDYRYERAPESDSPFGDERRERQRTVFRLGASMHISKPLTVGINLSHVRNDENILFPDYKKKRVEAFINYHFY